MIKKLLILPFLVLPLTSNAGEFEIQHDDLPRSCCRNYPAEELTLTCKDPRTIDRIAYHISQSQGEYEKKSILWVLAFSCELHENWVDLLGAGYNFNKNHETTEKATILASKLISALYQRAMEEEVQEIHIPKYIFTNYREIFEMALTNTKESKYSSYTYTPFGLLNLFCPREIKLTLSGHIKHE